MAINYATKYADNVDERFTLEALSTPAINQDLILSVQRQLRCTVRPLRQ